MTAARLMLQVLHLALLAETKVSCGGHEAASCAQCVQEHVAEEELPGIALGQVRPVPRRRQRSRQSPAYRAAPIELQIVVNVPKVMEMDGATAIACGSTTAVSRPQQRIGRP
eukprot:s1707_g5.t1